MPASTTRSSRSSTQRVVERADDGAHEVAVGRLELLGQRLQARPRRRSRRGPTASALTRLRTPREQLSCGR